MNTAIINDARKFSLDRIEKIALLETGDFEVTLLCFEAGQRDEESVYHTSSLYQVLEGEALVDGDGDRERLGKGKVLAMPAGVPHVLENAGGGLLVIMATRAR
ncbi:MAG: cupin domain-containing protein [Trueperaceae bacterium]